jgi:hypothetical protein
LCLSPEMQKLVIFYYTLHENNIFGTVLQNLSSRNVDIVKNLKLQIDLNHNINYFLTHNCLILTYL